MNEPKDREELTEISREFEEVLNQVAAGKQPENSPEPPSQEEEEQMNTASSSERVRAWKQPDEDKELELPPSEIPCRWEDEEEYEKATPYEPETELSELEDREAEFPEPENLEPEFSESEDRRTEIPMAGIRKNRYSKGRTGARRVHHSKGGLGGLVRPSDGLLAAFFIPVIIMVVIFAQRGIFPFGQESFLRTDMFHQYAPFFSEFQHKLRTGESLLYSWNIGMGINFAALYAYYLASPLNWLLILCPKAYIIEFMTYMIVFKIGLSGLSFAWYLGKHHQKTTFGAGFFGVFYALSGYMAAYSWNIMWLDCILLFPLIMWGLERLVKEKKGMFYCITLGLSILSNYYISIMICVFMTIYFICLLILEGRDTFKSFCFRLVQFAGYSLIAGALAAIVLLPEIAALQSTASGDFSFPKTYEMYFSIIDMLARHIPNVQTEIGLAHWPNIYCGVAVYIFFLLYLVCKKIPLKEKVVYCGLLLFFFASFSVNVLNFIWHGFHYPNSLPARQSFIYIFLILSVCYHAYLYLEETPRKHITLAFLGSVCYVLIAQKQRMDDEAYHFIVFYAAILFLAIYTGLIFFAKNPRRSKAAAALLALSVVSVEAAVNTTVTSVTKTSREAYTEDDPAILALTRDLQSDSGFYRIDKSEARTKNDGAWMNFPTASLFSSLASADVTDFFKKMGCEGSTNAYSIVGSTPLVDSLFSIQYALYQGKQENSRLSLYSYEDDMYLYENPYTLPLGFIIPNSMETDWQTELPNPIDVQNDLSNVLNVPYSFEQLMGDNQGSTFTFTAEQDGEYYICIMNRQVRSIRMTVGERTESFDSVNRGYLIETGVVRAGDIVTLENRDGSDALNARAYRFDEEGLRGIYERLNTNPFTVTEWTSDRIEGVIDAGEGGTMFLSIPYDEGWNIEVDGISMTARNILGAFTGLELSAGRHTIVFQYQPEGLRLGMMISAAAVALLLLIAAAGYLLRKRKTVPSPYDKLDEEWSRGDAWIRRDEAEEEE